MNIKVSNRTLYREALDYIMIALGCVLYPIGWILFLIPNDIGNGGTAGLSSILFWSIGLHPSVSFFVLNGLLLCMALPTLGLKFCIKTIYGVIVLSLAAWVLRALYPHPTILAGEPMMSSLIGAIFCGLGLGLCLSHNGSSGGSDVVAAVVNKYKDISLGRAILLVDVLIVILTYFVFHDWNKVIYGYLALFVTAMVLDQVVNMGVRSVQFLVVSERYEEICKQITDLPPHRGCTIIDAHGYYTGKTTKIVLIVTRQREAGYIYSIIDDIDPNAFVTQTAVMGVFGHGFEKFKVKHKAHRNKNIIKA